MQHFPGQEGGALVGPAQRRRFLTPAEVHPDNAEIDAAIDWLAHIAAGRIQVR